MTKEELEKEASEYASEWGNKFDGTYACSRDGYLAGAEPREKRIAELEAEVTRLRNENLDIINKYTRFAETDKRTIAELEAQIEQMKCCGNCKHFNYEEVGTGNKDCILWQVHKIFCKNKDKWQLRR